MGYGDDLYTPDEKVKYIEEYFKNHPLKEKYDLSINSPVNFINVNLIEK